MGFFTQHGHGLTLLSLLYLAIAQLLFPGAAYSQKLPGLAVYVIGSAPDNNRNVFGRYLTASLINNGICLEAEGSAAFLNAVYAEQARNGNSAINDSVVSELGKRYGVQFVCVADIIPVASGNYRVNARIVDTKNALSVIVGEVVSPLKTTNDITRVSDELVKVMFGRQGAESPSIGMSQQTYMPESAGQDQLKNGGDAGRRERRSFSFGGGVFQGSNFVMASSYSTVGTGMYLFFNSTYADIVITHSNAGDYLLNSDLVIGAFAKYPFAVGASKSLKIFPMLGINVGEHEVAGSIGCGTDMYINKDTYLLGELLVGIGIPDWYIEVFATTLRGLIERDLGKNIYVRGELLYGMTNYEQYHILILRAGAGLKF